MSLYLRGVCWGWKRVIMWTIVWRMVVTELQIIVSWGVKQPWEQRLLSCSYSSFSNSPAVALLLLQLEHCSQHPDGSCSNAWNRTWKASCRILQLTSMSTAHRGWKGTVVLLFWNTPWLCSTDKFYFGDWWNQTNIWKRKVSTLSMKM